MKESQRKYSQLDAEACLETVHLQFAISLYRLYSDLSCIGDVLYACVFVCTWFLEVLDKPYSLKV